jgi:hypothetical protein
MLTIICAAMRFPFSAIRSGKSRARAKYGFAEEKAEAIEDLMPVLSAIKNPIQKRDALTRR